MLARVRTHGACAAGRYETVQRLEQQYVFIPRKVKETYLAYLLRTVLEDQTVIIFTARCQCGTRRGLGHAPSVPTWWSLTLARRLAVPPRRAAVVWWRACARTCETLRLTLKSLGVRNVALHSHMSQNDRLGSLAKFKSGIVKVLLATDVGSRCGSRAAVTEGPGLARDH